MSFSDKLEQALDGESAGKFAARLTIEAGIPTSRQSVEAWLAGKNHPSYNAIIGICIVTGKPFEFFHDSERVQN